MHFSATAILFRVFCCFIPVCFHFSHVIRFHLGKRAPSPISEGIGDGNQEFPLGEKEMANFSFFAFFLVGTFTQWLIIILLIVNIPRLEKRKWTLACIPSLFPGPVRIKINMEKGRSEKEKKPLRPVSTMLHICL